MTLDPFRTRDHVADFDGIVADIVRRSEKTRATVAMVADVAYGPDPIEKADIFFPEGPRDGLPVHMFIHGGYWRMFSRRDYSYIAETVTRAGAIAVIVDYALMPAVRMATIVDQVRCAKRWVFDQIADFGGNPNRLTLSGHSAGAHLATMLFNEDAQPSGIRGALLLSGLYNLKPLQDSFLTAEIAITDEEVERFSPLTHRFDVSVKVDIRVGEDETSPFHEQAKAFATHLENQRLRASSSLLAGNHMSSVRDLGTAGTAAAKALEDIIGLRDRRGE